MAAPLASKQTPPDPPPHLSLFFLFYSKIIREAIWTVHIHNPEKEYKMAGLRHGAFPSARAEAKSMRKCSSKAHRGEGVGMQSYTWSRGVNLDGGAHGEPGPRQGLSAAMEAELRGPGANNGGCLFYPRPPEPRGHLVTDIWREFPQ